MKKMHFLRIRALKCIEFRVLIGFFPYIAFFKRNIYQI